MDLGTASIGFFLSVDMLDQVVTEARRIGNLPTEVVVGDISYPALGLRNVTVVLDTPRLSVVDGPMQLLLHLTGRLDLRVAGDSIGPVTETRPLDVRIRANPTDQVNADGDPVVVLAPAGAEAGALPPEVEGFIDLILTLSPLGDLLGALELPVYRGLIDAAGEMLFPDETTRPAVLDWERQTLLLAGPGDSEPCLMSAVAPPGTALSGLPTTSPLSTGNALGIAYDDNFLDPVLAAGAAEQVGSEIDGARIDRLSLSMGDNFILVDGRASKDGATITFKGPITLSFRRASNMILTNADQVDVDVDLPWYLWLATALGFVFGGPILGVVLLGNVVFPALDEAAGAPATVQRALIANLNLQMAQLVTAITNLDSFAGIEATLITDSADFRDGTIAVFAEVIVTPFESEIVEARRYRSFWFQRYDSPFQEFDLSNGRTYPTAILAELLKSDKVIIPGYHGVDGRTRKYVRGNPDDQDSNNLDGRFPGPIDFNP